MSFGVYSHDISKYISDTLYYPRWIQFQTSLNICELNLINIKSHVYLTSTIYPHFFNKLHNIPTRPLRQPEDALNPPAQPISSTLNSSFLAPDLSHTLTQLRALAKKKIALKVTDFQLISSPPPIDDPYNNPHTLDQSRHLSTSTIQLYTVHL